MGRRTLTLLVDGMTCSSCEKRIERALLSIPGILRAEARARGGRVVVEYDEGLTSPQAVKAAIEGSGYAVKDGRGASTLIALGIGLTLAAAYMIAGASGLFNALPRVDASIGYGMLFVVGLLTSVHCVAMCGGISLSQSVRPIDEGPDGAPARTDRARRGPGGLAPGLLYNGGRVVSYTIIGGTVGAIGSALSFSPGVKGAIAGAAGLFMLYLGLRMLGLVPALPKASRLLPSALGRRLDGARRWVSDRGPFAVGLLNGLMPCGPLQTMQLYALGTGSLLAGAFSMLVFSLGTVPLMLAFGLAAALVPRRFLPVMVKASAVLVMFLGVVTFSRAATLAGIPLPSYDRAPVPGVFAASTAVAVKKDPLIVAKLGNGVQTVTTEFKDGYYVPFVVQAGLPLKWTIRVTARELNGCNNPVTVPSYGITKKLVAGDNLVEFTPKKTGTIVYTCWMGMVSSRISVVSDLEKASAAPVAAAPALPESGAALGGCCAL